MYLFAVIQLGRRALLPVCRSAPDSRPSCPCHRSASPVPVRPVRRHPTSAGLPRARGAPSPLPTRRARTCLSARVSRHSGRTHPTAPKAIPPARPATPAAHRTRRAAAPRTCPPAHARCAGVCIPITTPRPRRRHRRQLPMTRRGHLARSRAPAPPRPRARARDASHPTHAPSRSDQMRPLNRTRPLCGRVRLTSPTSRPATSPTSRPARPTATPRNPRRQPPRTPPPAPRCTVTIK